ncbi:hypothetical protein, partial [Enterobacter intestinihominis]
MSSTAFTLASCGGLARKVHVMYGLLVSHLTGRFPGFLIQAGGKGRLIFQSPFPPNKFPRFMDNPFINTNENGAQGKNEGNRKPCI